MDCFKNVLSLFDGMSCGQISLKELGANVETYYASEVEKYPMQVTNHNFPNTIQLGDVRNVDVSKLQPIDLLIGGSPCQNFSFSGKRKGMSTKCSEDIYTLEKYMELKNDGFEFEGQSYLFWEYMRILNDIRKYNPDVVFLLENVEMGKKWERVLSEAIGLYGVHINSALVSAQNRKRIYWFGQNRERYFYSENYCYICSIELNKFNNDKRNRRIQDSSQRKGAEAILGETQIRQEDVRSVPDGIFKNRKKGYNKNLLGAMSEDVEEENRRKQEQNKKGHLSKGILSKKQGTIIGLSKEIQKDREGERNNEESRLKFIKAMQKKNENTFKEGNKWHYCDKDGRFNINIEHETNMHCVCCGKELDYRPHNSVVSYGDKRDYKSPSTLSKVQFNEARQNNGRVFDILKTVVLDQNNLFGESYSDIPQPQDKGILLKDILEKEVDEKYFLSEKMLKYFDTRAANFNNGKVNIRQKDDKATTLTASMASCDISDNFVAINANGNNGMDNAGTVLARYHKGPANFGAETFIKIDKAGNVKDNQDKASCFTAGGNSGGNHSDMDLIIIPKYKNGENLKSQTRRGRKMEQKSNCLMAKETDFMQFTNDFKIRRLTPTECKRLQTVPDWYDMTILSDTQQYKALGNGWTIEVIKHILSFCKQ